MPRQQQLQSPHGGGDAAEPCSTFSNRHEEKALATL
jgi:hypothetical protein